MSSPAGRSPAPRAFNHIDLTVPDIDRAIDRHEVAAE
jgi:hypothetical protein